MSGRVSVKRVSSDGLRMKEWWFAQDGTGVVFDYYKQSTRSTKRHGWKSVKAYLRLGTRTYFEDMRLDLKDVPMNEDIKQEALQEALKSLKLYSDYRKEPLEINDLSIDP